RIWRNKKMLHRELKDRLIEQITKGQNPRKAARIMRETIEQSVYNTERIMRTESSRVQTEVQMESFKKAGFEEYEFITTEGACEICEPLDGKIFKVKDYQPGNNASPMHPHCRCSTAAYMDSDEWNKNVKEKGLLPTLMSILCYNRCRDSGSLAINCDKKVPAFFPYIIKGK